MKRAVLILCALLASIATELVPSTTKKTHKKAVTVVPVADLVGEPLGAAHLYREIPVCGGSASAFQLCKRIHQLLFNEVVTVLQEHGDEILIELPNLFYVTRTNTKTPNTTYWTLKSNVMSFDELHKKGVNTGLFPDPITMNSKKLTAKNSQEIVTLSWPWYDPISKNMYSVGTRFVAASHDAHAYTVHIFDKNTGTMTTTSIPRTSVVALPHSATVQERLIMMVDLIRSWATIQNGYSPYVLGGGSLTLACTNNDFEEVFVVNGNDEGSYFEIPGYSLEPKIGFDCTSVVARAAQIVGLPYYFKNTTTLEHHAPMLAKKESLAIGDLILMKGHVMVVADLDNNTLLEARSYQHGYGRLQEIFLGKVFKDITTYADLTDAYRTKKTIYRIDSKGDIKDTIPHIKLIKMARL